MSSTIFRPKNILTNGVQYTIINLLDILREVFRIKLEGGLK